MFLAYLHATATLLLIPSPVAAVKGLDDSVLFRINWQSQTEIPANVLAEAEAKANSPDSSAIYITSGDDERYLCSIPDVATTSRKKIEHYSGPTPNELLMPLYGERLCSYRLEPYWSYELCHGRYILQYYMHKEGKGPRIEYYLGQYRSELTKQEDKAFDQLNPPTRKIDENVLPYYTVSYTQGTVCDINGKPRTTNVIYVCMQDARNQIYSLSEISSCHYEVVVLTARLCAHPSFQPNVPKENEIVCYSRDSRDSLSHEGAPKPKALVDFERHRYRAAVTEEEYSTTGQSTRATVVDGGEDEEDDLGIVEIQPKPSSLRPTTSQDVRVEKVPVDEQLARAFLSGQHCLYGGGGWWKYEYCHGKQVVQYHDAANSPRVEIVLGIWDSDVHLHWIAGLPQKRPIKENGRTIQVSHFYSGGDVCDETKTHRSVEVQLRCRQSEGNANAVTLYLLEPRTCQYVLGVESSLYCSLIQYADEKTGLIPTDALT